MKHPGCELLRVADAYDVDADPTRRSAKFFRSGISGSRQREPAAVPAETGKSRRRTLVADAPRSALQRSRLPIDPSCLMTADGHASSQFGRKSVPEPKSMIARFASMNSAPSVTCSRECAFPS